MKVIYPIIKFKVHVLTIISFLLTQSLIAQVPTINSFSPALGPVGTTVTLTGTNFSTIPANNIVYLGAVKATVTNATTTALTIKIPLGTTFQPITVTVAGLTGYSKLPFLTTFPGGGNQFTPNSFAPRIDSSTGALPYTSSIADIDGDGKPDLLVVNNTDNTLYIYSNTGFNDTLSFSLKIQYGVGSGPYSIAIADIDGDGKLDIAIPNSLDTIVGVWRNTSTPGAMSFAIGQVYGTGTTPRTVALGDLDGDGKPDMVVGNYGDSTISVYHNTGSLGTISFSPGVKYITGSGGRSDIYKVCLADLDGDGKLDIAASNSFYSTIAVFRNTSSPGTISLATRKDVPTALNVRDFSIGDLDGDGSPDLAVANYTDNTVSLFRNTSSAGNIAFANPAIYYLGGLCRAITIGDLDGDGKPELAVTTVDSNKVGLLKNNCTVGTIAFSNPVFYSTAAYPHSVSIGDLDGDGKPDIAIASQAANKYSIFRNQSGSAYITSFTSTGCAGAGSAIKISGFGFTNSIAVSFGGVAASSFTVVSDTAINAVIGSGGLGTITILTSLGTASYSIPSPVITSFTPTAAGTGATITIKGKYFCGATALYFGATAAASFAVVSDSVITAKVGAGSSGNISVTTPFGAGVLSGFAFAVQVPVITSFTPDSASIGMAVNISGHNFTGTTAVTFGAGFAATSFTLVSDSLIIAIVGNGNGTIGNIAVTNSAGTDTTTGFQYITTYCPGNTIDFSASPGTIYQWQQNTGTGFTNIQGQNTAYLNLTNAASSLYGYQYRCIVDGVPSSVNTVKFNNVWTGAIDSAWEKAGNWSCGEVPDSYTDVYISKGVVVLSSNTTVRSLTVNPTASFTIKAPFIINVTH